MASSATRLSEILIRSQGELLDQWIKMQLAATSRRADLIREDESPALARAA